MNELLRKIKKSSMKKLSVIFIILFGVGLLDGQTTDEKRDFHYAYGLYNDDLYELAASAFEEYLEKYSSSPNRSEALFYLGDCYFFLGKYKTAVEKYKLLIRTFPEKSAGREAGLRLAQAYYYLGENGNGLRAIDDYLRYKPRDPEALYWKSEILYALKRYSGSIAAARNSLKIDSLGSDAPYVHNLLIYNTLALKDTLAALRLCDDFIKKRRKHPLLINVLMLKGKLLADIKKYDKALAVFEYVSDNAAKAEEKAEALFRMGEIYLRLKDYGRAQNIFSEVIEKYPDSIWIEKSRYNLGWSYLKEKKYNLAAETFSFSAIHAADSTVRSLSILKLGETYSLSGRPEQARNAWRQLLTWPGKNSAKIQAHYELGLLDFANRKFEDAVNHFDEVRNSGDPGLEIQALKMTAESWLALGKDKKADELFASLSPKDGRILAEALYQRGWIAYKEKKWGSAEKIFRRLINKKQYPDICGLANFWLGEIIFIRDKNYPAAARYYLASLSLEHDKKNEALYGYAWCLLKQKAYGKAEKNFLKLRKQKNTLPPSLASDVEIRLADIAFLTGKYSLAAKRYGKIISRNELLDESSRVYVLDQLALSYRRLGKYDKAREVYAEAVKRQPEREGDYMLKRAEALFESERFADFISEVSAIMPSLTKPCLLSRALYEKGDAFYNIGRYDKAINSYLKSIEVEKCVKYRRAAWSGIVYSAVASGDPEKADVALKEIKPLLKKDELYGFLLYQAKYLLGINIGKKLDAILKEALIYAPNQDDKAEAYRLLGVYYRNLGDKNAAFRMREKAFNLYTNANSKASLALTLITEFRDRGELSSMERWLVKLEKLSPLKKKYRYEYLLNRCYYQLEKGNTAEAEKSFTSAEKISASNDYLEGLSDLLRAKLMLAGKDYYGAEKKLNGIIARRTDIFAAEAQLALGFLYEKKGNDKLAVENFLRVRYLYGGYKHLVADAMYQAARIEIRRGNKDKARKIVEKLQKEFGDSEWSDKAAKLL